MSWPITVNPSHKFMHRYSSHGDRSSGAYGAENRGLEGALEASRRLRVPLAALRKASAESSTPAAEWHHVRVKGEPAAELDYRPPEEWDALTVSARTIASAQRKGLIARATFIVEVKRRGLTPFENGADFIQALDGDGKVQGHFEGRAMGRARWYYHANPRWRVSRVAKSIGPRAGTMKYRLAAIARRVRVNPQYIVRSGTRLVRIDDAGYGTVTARLYVDNGNTATLQVWRGRSVRGAKVWAARVLQRQRRNPVVTDTDLLGRQHARLAGPSGKGTQQKLFSSPDTGTLGYGVMKQLRDEARRAATYQLQRIVKVVQGLHRPSWEDSLRLHVALEELQSRPELEQWRARRAKETAEGQMSLFAENPRHAVYWRVVEKLSGVQVGLIAATTRAIARRRWLAQKWPQAGTAFSLERTTQTRYNPRKRRKQRRQCLRICRWRGKAGRFVKRKKGRR